MYGWRDCLRVYLFLIVQLLTDNFWRPTKQAFSTVIGRNRPPPKRWTKRSLTPNTQSRVEQDRIAKRLKEIEETNERRDYRCSCIVVAIFAIAVGPPTCLVITKGIPALFSSVFALCLNYQSSRRDHGSSPNDSDAKL